MKRALTFWDRNPYTYHTTLAIVGGFLIGASAMCGFLGFIRLALFLLLLGAIICHFALRDAHETDKEFQALDQPERFIQHYKPSDKNGCLHYWSESDHRFHTVTRSGL